MLLSIILLLIIYSLSPDKNKKMTTPATIELPEIKWERGEYLESPDDYVKTYIAKGTSKNGSEWSGTWIECCDDVEIEDIKCEREVFDDLPNNWEPNYNDNRLTIEQKLNWQKLK